MSLVGITVVMLLVLRFFSIDADPDASLTWSGSFFSDEGWYAGNAIKHRLSGDWITDKYNPMALMPFMPLVYDAAFAIFGVSLSVARYVTLAFVLLLCVVAMLMIVRDGLHEERWLLTLLFFIILLTNYYFFIYGRLALFDLPMYAIGLAGLFFFLLSIHNQRISSVALAMIAGLTIAVSTLTKTSGIMFVGVLVLANVFYFGARWKLPTWKEILPSLICLGTFAALYLLTSLILPAAFGEAYWIQRAGVTSLMPGSLRTLLGNYRRLFEQTFLVNNSFLILSAIVGLIITAFRSINQRAVSWVNALFAALLLGHLSFLGMFRYRPPRYFVGMTVPIAYFTALIPVQIARLVNRARWRPILVVGSIVLVGCCNFWNISRTFRYIADPPRSMVEFGEAAKARIDDQVSGNKPYLIYGELSTLAALLGLNRHNVSYTREGLTHAETVQLELFFISWKERAAPEGFQPILSMPVLNNYYTGYNLVLYSADTGQSNPTP